MSASMDQVAKLVNAWASLVRRLDLNGTVVRPIFRKRARHTPASPLERHPRRQPRSRSDLHLEDALMYARQLRPREGTREYPPLRSPVPPPIEFPDIDEARLQQSRDGRNGGGQPCSKRSLLPSRRRL